MLVCLFVALTRQEPKAMLSRGTLVLSILLVLPFIWQYVAQTFDGFDGNVMLAGKKVLVCGASSGIGEQMAYE